MATLYQDTKDFPVRITLAALYPPDVQVEEINLCFAPVSVIGVQDSRAQLLTTIMTQVGDVLQPTLSSLTTWYGGKCSVLGWVPAPMPIVTIRNLAGTSGAAFVPTQSRPLVSWVTPFAGRGYRGRNYLWTPAAVYLNATTGGPTTAYAGIANTVIGNLQGNLFTFSGGGATTNWQMCVVHRIPKTTTSPAQYIVRGYIQEGVFRNVFATQRRSGALGRPNPSPPF